MQRPLLWAPYTQGAGCGLRYRHGGEGMTKEGTVAAWLALGQKLIGICNAVAQEANILKDGQVEYVKLIAMALMCRTMNNFRAVGILVENRCIVEARTITRCCYENLFFIGGIQAHGQQFITMMDDDHKVQKLRLGKEILERSKQRGDTLEFGGSLEEFVEELKKEALGKKALVHRDLAVASDLVDSYTVYRQLSADAAHPSATAISRHVATRETEAVESYDVHAKPMLTGEDEVWETVEMACFALMAVSVGTNTILGNTQAGKMLVALEAEFRELSAKSREKAN